MAQDLSHPDDTLQVQGAALLGRWAAGEDATAEAEDLVARLRIRDWEGDDVLVEDLEAALGDVAIAARRLPVALDELASQVEGDPGQEPGLLDLQTGEVLPGFMTDAGMVGDDAVVDVDDDPDRWLGLPWPDSRRAWDDMVRFADRAEPPLRDRLERALHGRGPFRRFRDVLFDADALAAFRAFADDRQRGRARQLLADQGIRAVPR